jgi:branched-chain amino acid transport system permease protein
MDFYAIARQLLIGIASGMVTFLAAGGVAIVMSGMGILNFGQGAFFVLGAYLCYAIVHVFNFWIALIFGPIIVALLAGLVELLLRPVYGKSMMYQLLITIGVGFVLADSMQTIWGKDVKIVNVPQVLSGTFAFMGLDFPIYYIFIMIISGLFAIGIYLMFAKTRLGMLFRAIISDRAMAGNLGINVSHLFTVMFMFGVGLSGVAGVLMAPLIGIDTSFGSAVLYTVMIVICIGGLGSMIGAFGGALIVGVVNALGSMLLPWFYTLIPATLMIIVLLVKPEGLFIKRER